MKSRKKVLILCTGNSCRSQMAEGLINHYLSDKCEAYSAGVAPSIVNSRAMQVMSEIGIDISQYRSKSVMEFLNRNDLDLVITVCDHARETCPVFFNPVEQIHIGFTDPVSYAAESDEIALFKFRQIRDDIKNRLIPFLEEYYDKE